MWAQKLDGRFCEQKSLASAGNRITIPQFFSPQPIQITEWVIPGATHSRIKKKVIYNAFFKQSNELIHGSYFYNDANSLSACQQNLQSAYQTRGLNTVFTRVYSETSDCTSQAPILFKTPYDIIGYVFNVASFRQYLLSQFRMSFASPACVLRASPISSSFIWSSS